MSREVLRGSVVGPSGGLRCAQLVIAGGRIAEIELLGPGDSETIIAPGFVDLQVNGFAGHDAGEGPEAIGAISELLRGTQDTAWVRLTEGPDAGTEVQVPIDTVQIGDEVVIHDHVAIPVDGEVVEGEAVVNQSAITGENLPVSVAAGTRAIRPMLSSSG